jgi:hypothetical protein
MHLFAFLPLHELSSLFTSLNLGDTSVPVKKRLDLPRSTPFHSKVEPGPSPSREIVVIGPFAATAKRHYKHVRLPFEPCTYRLRGPPGSAFSPSVAL